MTAAMDLTDLEAMTLRELQEARHGLVAMTQQPGWDVFRGFVNRSLAGRLNEAMKPAASIPDVLESEYKKGQYAGLVLPFKALDGWIDELNQAIAAKEPTDA